MTLTIDLDEITRDRLEIEAQLVGKTLEAYAGDLLRSSAGNEADYGVPNLGWAKGMIKMSEDFDAPLEDFRDYE